MTIYRGPGGTGTASSEVDTTEYQEFLVQTQAAKEAAEAARDAALAAETNAELAETNAETAETNAETAETNASASASAAASSASAAATSASNAATSASEAAASAAVVNPANIVFNTNTYANPSWLTSLAWSKVTGTPTTIAGYGITNAYTKTEVDASLATKLNATTGAVGTTNIADGAITTIKFDSGAKTPLAGAADTAAVLATARTIGGVSFNGSTNINLPGVNATGNQNTSGNAATASAVAWTGVTGRPTAVSAFTNDAGYITSAPAPSTANVLSAYAGASFGAVGTYGFFSSTAGAIGLGGTLGGGSLQYFNGSSTVSAGVSGTWRFLGWNAGGSGTSLYLRIS
jgi:hypothetical protein